MSLTKSQQQMVTILEELLDLLAHHYQRTHTKPMPDNAHFYAAMQRVVTTFLDDLFQH